MADATEHDRDGQPGVAAVFADVVGDLGGEFTRGRQDERAGRLGLPGLRRARETVDDGECEGCGLAGAGLGDAEKVAPRDNGRGVT
jgi:hypothetical protein